MVSNKIISMKKLSICLFLVLFGFSAPSNELLGVWIFAM
jgi:hypothetical protein